MATNQNNITKELGPPDFFREIGFDTAFFFDGRCDETIFFIGPRCSDNPRGERRKAASPEAIAEFIAYWSNQIEVAADYLRNNCNPNTHEWIVRKGESP